MVKTIISYPEPIFNLVKRCWGWELVWLTYSVVNSLAITYIGAGMEAISGRKVDTSCLVLYLLVDTLVFDNVSEMIAWERLDLGRANLMGSLLVLMAGTLSFIGLGIVAAVLPLLFPERGSQMTHVGQALILLISGVHYPVSVLPNWMQPIARLSPATYVLEGMRQMTRSL